MEEDIRVRNHICNGLEKYQSRLDENGKPTGYQCIPIFNSMGETQGCDDTNITIIEYCPFCGFKFEEVNNKDRE